MTKREMSSVDKDAIQRAKDQIRAKRENYKAKVADRKLQTEAYKIARRLKGSS